MNNNAPILLLLIGSLLPLPAFAGDAQDIIDKVLELDEERRKEAPLKDRDLPADAEHGASPWHYPGQG